jgi:hypothetical protein
MCPSFSYIFLRRSFSLRVQASAVCKRQCQKKYVVVNNFFLREYDVKFVDSGTGRTGINSKETKEIGLFFIVL